ncbi:MAG: cation-transporting P-type ATPase, partial [Chloroflexota bacterium]
MDAPVPAPAENSPHTIPVDQVYQALASRPDGLTADEVAARLERYGRNVLRREKGTPLWVRFLSNFTHLMALLLWVGGAMAFVARMPQLGIAVWMVNVINGAFSFWQEFRAEKATEALQELLPSYARVMRDGVECEVP